MLQEKMFKLLTILMVFFLQALASKSTDPILYAVDLGDGAGSILLKKLSQRCQYYKSVKDNPVVLMRFYSGQWEITQGPNYSWGNSGCSQTSGTGTQLFVHEGEDMSNGSWVNVQKDNIAANLSIYALEDCTTYEGAFFEGNFKEVKMKSEDTSQCPNEAAMTGKAWNPGNNVNVNLFTTTTQIASVLKFRTGIPRRYNLCRYRAVDDLTFLKINETDENARVIVRG